MEQSHRATLNGLPLPAFEAIGWQLTPGIAHHEAVIPVLPQQKDQLLAARGPMSLSIDGVEFKHLYVIEEVPAANPYEAAVRVVDRRYWWGYKHILRRFNMRRRVGFFRASEPGVAELQRVSDNVQYARYSLRGDNPWTAKECVESVLSELIAHEPSGGTSPGFKYRPSFERVSSNTVENLEVDEAGDKALGRVLSYLPEATLFIDRDGQVNLCSRLSDFELTEERAVLSALGPQIEGSGRVTVVSHENSAPSEIHVLWTPEVEVRFDYNISVGSSTVPDPYEEERQLVNVIAVPDYSIEINGVTYPQGSWVPYEDYVNALPAFSGFTGTFNMDMNFILAAMTPHSPMWGALALIGEEDPDADWMARAGALQQYFRTAFRVPRGWMDRISSIKAYRVATTNQVDGSRAPAEVYTDYTVLGNERSWRANWNGAPNMLFGMGVDGYSEIISEDTKPAPASVSILDKDQGIIGIQFQVDPVRMYDKILPGRLKRLEAPGVEQTRYGPTRPITFDTVINSPIVTAPQLTASHDAAIIVTVIPAAPNTSEQLYRVVIKPEDVGALVPKMPSGFKGPIKEIRVRPGLETARIRWLDSRSQDTEALLGLAQGPANLDGLVVNSTASANGGIAPGRSGYGASLDELSKAVAARYWGSLASHPVGQTAGRFAPDAVPDGWTEAIHHSLDPDGVLATSATFGDRLPEFDWISLLDSGTRAIIMREVFRG